MDGRTGMEAANVSGDVFREALQARFGELARDVARAVNDAPDGAWINGSEMQVRDLFADLRRVAYETALQMRLDVKQAAFSPGGPGAAGASVEQRPGKPQHADGQRSGGDHA